MRVICLFAFHSQNPEIICHSALLSLFPLSWARTIFCPSNRRDTFRKQIYRVTWPCIIMRDSKIYFFRVTWTQSVPIIDGGKKSSFFSISFVIPYCSLRLYSRRRRSEREEDKTFGMTKLILSVALKSDRLRAIRGNVLLNKSFCKMAAKRIRKRIHWPNYRKWILNSDTGMIWQYVSQNNKIWSHLNGFVASIQCSPSTMIDFESISHQSHCCY